MPTSRGSPTPRQTLCWILPIFYPAKQEPKSAPRVVMTPLSAKLLVKALTENLARYETAFGEINLPTNNSLADNLFRPFQQPPEDPKGLKDP